MMFGYSFANSKVAPVEEMGYPFPGSRKRRGNECAPGDTAFGWTKARPLAMQSLLR